MPLPGLFERKRSEMPSSGWIRSTSRFGPRFPQQSRLCFLREQAERRRVKLNGNIGHALRHALAGPDVKRHAGPTPVIDEECHRGVGVGLGIWIDARLLARKPGKSWPPTSARTILARDSILGNIFRLHYTHGAQAVWHVHRVHSSASKTVGGSIATVAITWLRWFWIMSRNAPASW